MRHQCPFCSIVRGEDPAVREVARNDKVVVFFPTDPAILGHCLVIPRRHVEEFSMLTKDEVDEVMITAQAMVKCLQEEYRPDGINIIQSNGEVASQSVAHVHIHVLPRWENDSVGEIWPVKSNFSEEQKDRALAKVRAGTALPSIFVSSEDRRQYLSFVQSVIARMAKSSANMKSWLLPVATAAYGYALTRESFPIAFLGIMATLVFAMLDVEYLRTERKFRELYEHIVAGDSEIPVYSLDYRRKEETWWGRLKERFAIMKTWTIVLFYGVLALTGIFVAYIAY